MQATVDTLDECEAALAIGIVELAIGIVAVLEAALAIYIVELAIDTVGAFEAEFAIDIAVVNHIL